MSGHLFDCRVASAPAVAALMSEAVYRLIGTEITRQESIAAISVNPKKRRLRAVGLKRYHARPLSLAGILADQLAHELNGGCIEKGSRWKTFAKRLLDLQHQP